MGAEVSSLATLSLSLSGNGVPSLILFTGIGLFVELGFNSFLFLDTLAADCFDESDFSGLDASFVLSPSRSTSLAKRESRQ